MGKIYQHFKNIVLRNEADVNQNFIIPFFTKFLGYSLNDLKPEREYPARDVFYGRGKLKSTKDFNKSQRPDFVIHLEEVSETKFIIESKAPSENLDNHLKQLISYSIGVEVNILVVTNGSEFRIYDVNNLIFKSVDLAEIDIKFEEIYKILSKENQLNFEPIEIIKNIDFRKALNNIDKNENQKRLLKISDFLNYLHFIKEKYRNWQNPIELHLFNDLEIEQYSPFSLHRFQLYEPSIILNREKDIYRFSELESKYKTTTKILIGPSGIGKTTLLKYTLYRTACDTLELTQITIPIYIQLRHYNVGQNIEKLILNSFLKSGLTFNEHQFRLLLATHSFLFLFDAFDEVQQMHHQNILSEIEELRSVEKHQIIITTRENNIINLTNSSKFNITPLDNNEIDSLITKYLGSSKYRFQSEARRNGFNSELKNTLLLTFLIMIFKETNNVPKTRFQIVSSIVGKIKNWESKKDNIYNTQIKWYIKEEILSELAYELINSSENFILSKQQLNNVLLPLIERYEKEKLISSTLDIHNIIDQLCSTGLVYYTDDGISFWHRIFVNYFASSALYIKGIVNMSIYESKRKLVKWANSITGSSSYYDNPTELIKLVLKDNLILATNCLLENDNADTTITDDIIEKLVVECSSEISDIRIRAINLLKLIFPKYTKDVFYHLLESNKNVDIRMKALEEIGKDGSIHAKKIIYSKLDWDEGGFPIGTTQGSIAHALSNFEEPEYLKILEIFKKKPDMFTEESCKNALLSIIRSGKATTRLKNEILNLYTKEKSSDDIRDKYGSLAEILKECNDGSMICDLISDMEKNENGYYKHILNTQKILSYYKSSKEIELIYDHAKKNKNILVRQVCASSLKDSNGYVEIEKYSELLNDPDALVRMYAIKGLKRFEFSEVQKYLFKYLNDVDGRVQSSVIDLLAHYSQLTVLLNQSIFPVKFYKLSFESLLENIIRYKLTELLKIIENFEDKIQDARLNIKIARAYLICGLYTKGRVIINKYLDIGLTNFDKYAVIDLAELAPHLTNNEGTKLIEEILGAIEDDKFESGYWEDKCIEALEFINTSDSKRLLKEIAQKNINNNHPLNIERALRSINNISTKEDEDWYLSFIKAYPNLMGFDLRRAIEGLGIIGSDKSLQLIKDYFNKHKENPFIKDTCFWSYQNILNMNGEYIVLREDELFN